MGKKVKWAIRNVIKYIENFIIKDYDFWFIIDLPQEQFDGLTVETAKEI